MHSVAGIFPTRDAAERAAASLALPPDRISVAAPAPVEPEDAGIGPALGGTVGGAVGAAAGSALGAAAAALTLPGVGPIIVTGIAAGLVFGAGGAAAGAVLGEQAEQATRPDPAENPRDVFFYHEALRRGRAVVLALASSAEEAEFVRNRFAALGGESIDAVREAWWTGLRESERSIYAGDFARDEADYRQGFEAALEAANRGRPLAENAAVPDAFRRGYERGYEYLRRLS